MLTTTPASPAFRDPPWKLVRVRPYPPAGRRVKRKIQYRGASTAHDPGNGGPARRGGDRARNRTPRRRREGSRPGSGARLARAGGAPGRSRPRGPDPPRPTARRGNRPEHPPAVAPTEDAPLPAPGGLRGLPLDGAPGGVPA